jgi:alpha-amylase
MRTAWKMFGNLAVIWLLAACVAGTPTATPTAAPVTPSSRPAASATPPPAATATVEPAESAWWNDAVFYEVFVRSFKDSDGDGVGDLNGLTESLDYLNDGDPATTTDLGVTALWLMPIMASPSYHGYDVTDYYTITPDYGTREDFERLMEAAHQRGMRVIVDLVLNHTGIDHPWFQASDGGDPAYRDWYVWSDENPNFRGPTGQVVWYRGKEGYYYAVFWSGMPDLNLENPAVTAEIDNIARFWLENMGVDGFRMDAIKHFVEQGTSQENTPATHAWLQAFHQFYKSVNPEAFAVGEAWTPLDKAIDYVGDEMDIVFEFDLAGAFLRSANGPLASSASQELDKLLAVTGVPKNQFGVFLTNHDQNRVMSVLKDVQKAKLAAVMLLTAPGVPFIYYGEEIGMTGIKPDEDIRRPMQWTGDNANVGFTTGTAWRAPARDYPETNVAAQTDEPDSLLSLYRTLIGLRNEHAALRTGDTLVVEPGTQRLYAVLRYAEHEAFLILVNPHPRPLTTELYGLTLAAGPFTGPVTAVSVLGLGNPAAPEVDAGGGFSSYQPFTEIPAQTAVIIQLTW